MIMVAKIVLYKELVKALDEEKEATRLNQEIMRWEAKGKIELLKKILDENSSKEVSKEVLK